MPVSPFSLHAAAAAFVVAAMSLSGCSKTQAPPSAASAASAPAVSASQAQQMQAFVIKGVLKQTPPGTEIALLPPGARDDKEKVATGIVQADGAIELRGQIPRADVYTVLISQKDTGADYSMVLEPGEYDIVDEPNFGPYIKGGTLNQLAYWHWMFNPEFVKRVNEEGELSAKLMNKLKPDDVKGREKAEAKLMASGIPQKIDALRDRLRQDIIEGPYPALAKAFVMVQFEGDKPYTDVQKAELLATYEKEAGPHPVFDRYRKRIAADQKNQSAKAQVAVGMPYKDITVVDKDGKAHMLSEVLSQHKIVMLDFWASWCSPCRAEFPALKQAYAKLKPLGFEIFAVSTDANRADWLKASQEENVPWLDFHDPSPEAAGAMNAYGVDGIPANFLISRDGKIVGKDAHGSQIEAAVKAAMKAVK